jgi:hypothetical protein
MNKGYTEPPLPQKFFKMLRPGFHFNPDWHCFGCWPPHYHTTDFQIAGFFSDNEMNNALGSGQGTWMGVGCHGRSEDIC